MATKKSEKKTNKSSAKKTASKATSSARTAKGSSTRPTKAAVKPTPKTTVKETTTMEASRPTQTSQSPSTQKTVKFKKSYVALIIIILLLGAGLYYFRGLFVAAIVNGQPISRLEVVRQSEKQVGQQTIETLVRNALIEQKAKEQKITVSDDEINQEIKKLQENLKKQGQDLNQVLQAQGMSQEDLKKLIRLDKLVAKMVGKDVKVTPDEVTKYIEQNRSSFPEGTSEADLKKQVEEQLKQQKTNEKVRDWLAQIQKEASIKYFVQY